MTGLTDSLVAGCHLLNIKDGKATGTWTPIFDGPESATCQHMVTWLFETQPESDAVEIWQHGVKGIEISDDDASKLTRVREAIAYLEAHATK